MSLQIKVIETTLTIQQNTLSVFHVIIQTSQSKVSLVRYPFDFAEFHQKIRTYYPKCKISFPTLQNPKRHPSKRKSFRDLIPRKSNAEKIQRYLDGCFHHPVVSTSSILKDFTRVQREEDASCFLDLMKATPPLPATLDDFDLLKVLGKGCIGKVFLVRSKRDHGLYALKIMHKKRVLVQRELEHIRSERDIMIQTKHQPFLVHLHHLFQSAQTLFLVLDYYPGGDLAGQLAIDYKFGVERARLYAAEILRGIEVLQSHQIVYRDLKPENVLIARNGHVVLADFGLGKIFTERNQEGVPLTQTFCGTAEYLAPEVLLGEAYTFVVDFWSLGTLMYEMLAGITPFWADNHMDMYRRVIEDPLDFPPTFDKHTCNLLSGLLEKEAEQRLGWGQDGILEIKSHAYFASIDWDILDQQGYRPEHIPSIQEETDVSHFDRTFTQMPVSISQSSLVQQDPFVAFDYDSTVIEFQKRPMMAPEDYLYSKVQD